MRFAAVSLLLALTAARAPGLPARLVDIDGAAVDLAALATSGRVIAVTLKTADCPVCARQLARLQQQRAELLRCGARFLVLAPGPADGIRKLRGATGFDARWIEDRDLALARSLGLVLGPGQMVPALLELDARGRVLWEQRGRSPTAFGDRALREHLDCEASET
jgi:peroxiredoxin